MRCMILCFALGVANIFHLGLVIIFRVICLYVPSVSFLSLTLLPTGRVCSFIIVFIEIPLLLRICSTSPTFDGFIRKIETNYMRAAT